MWYWVEGHESGSPYRFTGNVYAYSVTNAAAPGWQRAVAATPIGTITISFQPPDQPTRMVANIGAENIELTPHRLRWLRSAWPDKL